MHVLIADDHPIFRSGLKFLLENSFDSIKISEVENGRQVLDFSKTNQPDIYIIDIDMPEKNGLEACKELTAKNLNTKVIILTMYKDYQMLKLAFNNGAKGYLVKDNTSEELVDCIQSVLINQKYISHTMNEMENGTLAQPINDEIFQNLSKLTQTELKTLKLVSRKLSSKEIADLLFVSVKSIENYRSRICKKLNLDARNNALLLWVIDNKEQLEKL